MQKSSSSSSTEESSKESKTSPRKEIISAVLFSHHARDGCFVHYVGTKLMSTELSLQFFGSELDPEDAWTWQLPSEGQQSRDDWGVFHYRGLARYLLYLTQVCTVFDPANVNSKLWLDSSKGNSIFYHRLGFRCDNTIPQIPTSFRNIIITPRWLCFAPTQFFQLTTLPFLIHLVLVSTFLKKIIYGG